MSFREKLAWITLVSMLACFGSYYGALALGLIGAQDFAAFHWGVVTIVAVFALQVGLRLAATAMSPKDATIPRDERERMIEARSLSVGYWVMVVGMIVVVVATHIRFPGMRSFMVTVYLGVGVLVVSAMSVAVSQIVMFRRGG